MHQICQNISITGRRIKRADAAPAWAHSFLDCFPRQFPFSYILLFILYKFSEEYIKI